MIRILCEDIGTQVLCKGKIKGVLRKLHFNEIVSIKGGRFTESVRGVKDLEVTVDYMSEEDYEKLQDVFLFSNTKLEIEDIDTGKIYVSYYIGGDTLTLEQHEDYINRNYYYKGGFSLLKR